MDPALAMEVATLARNRALNEAIETGGSEIQQFYKDATIFITGGTGFLGKQLVEKLFRSCEIKKVYMLIRPKRRRNFYERPSQILEDPVFDTLRKQKPDFASRICAVQGDVAEPGLGISDQDRPSILQEVNIIIHAAATTNFDEPLKVATFTNVRGTLEVIELAKSCPKLKSFVHISSAFSYATMSNFNGEVLEKFYAPPLSPKLLVEMAESMEEHRLNDVTPQLIEDWPNTYTLTKAIAEEACRQAGAYLPICVVRPSIVICSNREPSPGWLDKSCLSGPSGLVVGMELGMLHAVNLEKTVKIDLVPVDFVNNAIIAAGWACSSHDIGGETEPKIYAVTSQRNPITFDKISETMKTDLLENYPSPKMMYYPFCIETSSKLLSTILVWFLHFIPAYVLDVMDWFVGKHIMAVVVYTKVNKLLTLLSYFMLNEWHFDDNNAQELFSSLSERDKVIYNFDVAKFDWYEQLIVWTLGARKYLIKDGLQGTEYAKKKMQWLKYLHYFVVCPLYALLLWNVVSFALTTFVLILSYIYGLFY